MTKFFTRFSFRFFAIALLFLGALQAKSQSIIITAPNGGEVLGGCQTYTIRWSASGTSNYFYIDYSVNNGASWASVATNILGTSGTFSWTVPNVSTSQALVRVRDAANANIIDQSNSVFTIIPALIINAPNGGEVWQGGTYQTINWVTTNGSNYYNLEYSIDAGISWNTIVTGLYNTNGFYSWLVPNTPSTTCLVRVTDQSNTCRSDLSDNMFAITPATRRLTLNTPNGGETLYPGTAYTISWTCAYLNSSTVKIEWSADSGATWATIAANATTSTNSGSYTWNIPNTPTTTAYVRVTENATNPVGDTTNADFTIYPYITLLSPNGGITWTGCTTQSFSVRKSSAVTYLKFEYSTDGGTTWNLITSSYYAGTSNLIGYSWAVPNIPTTNLKIRVSDYYDATRVDVSDAGNTIVRDQSIVVNSPVGGEIWQGGTYQTVSWAGAGVSGYYVVDYSTDNGITWNSLYSGYSTSTSWLVPNTPTTQAKVRVRDGNNTCKEATSPGTFTITQATPVLYLTSMNNGGIYYAGNSTTISWSCNYLPSSFVKLEYSVDSGLTWTSIVNSYSTGSTSGSYVWVMPNRPTSLALVKISVVGAPTVADTSNNVFAIRPFMTLLTPNGGEQLNGCGSYTISWNHGAVSNYYKIEYSTNGGTTWTTIVTNYYISSSPTASYTWSIPNIPSTNCLVRVSDYSDATKTDVSNATFTIIRDQSIVLNSPIGGEIWQVGTYQTVSWAGSGVSGYYTVDYSSDNGITWSSIYTGYSTSFSWFIPNTPTSQALVRVRDGNNTCKEAISPATFTISSGNQIISVYNPTSGTVLHPTESYTIRWTNQYLTTSFVKIEFSPDSGTTWQTVVLNTSTSTTSGSYVWSVPNTVTRRALIKVTAANNPAVFGISPMFTINPFVTVLTPNGGETWNSCATRTITWEKANTISYLKFEYTIDSGLSWTTIATNYYAGSSTTGSYSWTLPNINTTKAKIRISDYSFPSRMDSSDNFFTIIPDQSIVLNSPVGGEVWQAGTYQTVSWAGANVSGYYVVDYSINNGVTWNSLYSGYSNAAYWLVPNTPSTTCLVRVQDGYNTCKQAISPATFTITRATPVLTLTSPNGGEVYYSGNTTTITWNCNYLATSFVKLEYSVDGGLTYTTIANAASTSTTSGSYVWTIPNLPTTQAIVRISNTGNPGAIDSSNAFFTIRPVMTIVSPNGGEQWNACTSRTISWTHGAVSNYYKIEYSVDGGLTYNTIVTNYYISNAPSASYTWSVPNIPTTNLRIRVSDYSSPSKVDVSDASATIIRDQSIVLNAPNGGEIWQGGTYQTISWAAAGVSGYYTVDYSTNNGVTWNSIYAGYSTSYTWLVPNVPTTQALVRIQDGYNTCKEVISQSNFTITAATPVLTLVTPNGGELYYAGNAATISWNCNYLPVSTVRLEYSVDSGATWILISSSVSTSTTGGSYSWSVPNLKTDNALVRISTTGTNSISDTSNRVFSIRPFITMVSPNGGEVVTACTSVPISWDHGSVSNYYKIDYSIDGGLTWTTIISSTYISSSPRATYYWSVPNIPTGNARIRVSDANTPSTKTDNSDNSFTIQPDRSIVLNAPVGGEIWQGGTYQLISWAGANVSGYYTVDYSIDNGITWNSIYAGYSTSYTWYVPNSPSTVARVRVRDGNNTCKEAISPGVFTITAATPVITISTPNGGETFYSGASSVIYWTSQFVSSSFVKIEYSLDSGLTWATVINATNNTGSYTWAVPAIKSTTAFIRISDYNNPSVVDYSNAKFTIKPPVTIIAPNGGEMVGGCTITTITWDRGGASNYFRLEYSLNKGTTWTTINSSFYTTAAIPSFNWSVPNLEGNNSCLVRVTDVNSTTKFDVSDTFFTIFPAIRLVEPNYGGNFLGNTVRNITWWDTLTSKYYNIEYSLNNGSTWTLITANTYIANNTFAWNVPNTTAASCLIRITDFQNTCKQDINDIPFNVTQVNNTLSWVSPNGGENYQSCQQVTLNWAKTGTTGNLVLEYSVNGGTSYSTIATNLAPSTTSYLWTIPSIQTNSMFIRVRDLSNAQVYDITNGLLSITVPVANAGIDMSFCAGDSVQLAASGNGTPSWTGGLAANYTPFAKPTATTTYTLTVTNAYGCSATDAVQVRVNAKPTISATGGSYCAGGSVQLSATGANTYAWSPSTGLSNPNSSSPVANPTSTTRYSLTATTNAGCSDTSSVWVTVIPKPSIPTVSNSGGASFCAGDSVRLTTTATGSLQWFVNGTNLAGSTNTSYVAKSTGAYGVTVTQNGCSSTSALTYLTVNPVPAVPTFITSNGLSICSGSSTTFTSSSGFGNQWLLGGSPIVGATSQTYIASTTGAYSLRVSNGSCSSTSSVSNLTVNQVPSATTISASGSLNFCSGDSVILRAGSSQGIRWYNGTNLVSGANDSVLVVKSTGNYTAVLNNGVCAGPASNSISVTVNGLPSTPTISASGATTFCSSDSVILTSSNATSYLWSNGDTTRSITVKASGNFSVRVSNAAGCKANSSVTAVTVNPVPAKPTATANRSLVLCAGDSVVFTSTASTGNQWYFNGSSISNSTGTTYAAKVAGNYKVRVTNGFGCFAESNEQSITVNPVPTQPLISASGPLSFCNGDSVVLTSSITSGIVWSNSATSASIVVKSSGNYSVTAINGFGCSTPSTVSVVNVNPIPLVPTISANASTTFCSGDSVVLSSTASSGNQWLLAGSVITGATSQTLTVKAGGRYSVRVTNASNCSSVSTETLVTVNAKPSVPVVTASGPLTFCSTDSVTLTSNQSGGLLWSNGKTTQSIVVKSSGTYTATITNGFGCSATSTATVVTVNAVPSMPTLSFTGASVLCTGDSVTLQSSATSGNQWLMNGNVITGATGSTYVVKAGGRYSVRVTNASNCSTTSIDTQITVNPKPSVPVVTASGPLTFCSTDSVTLTSNQSGGLLWSNGKTTQSIVVKSSGTYTATITNGFGCSATSSATVVTVNAVPSKPTLSFTGASVLCTGDSVTLQSSATSGNQWLLNGNVIAGATGSTFVVKAGGRYSVRVTNASNCSTTSIDTQITVNPKPSVPVVTASGPLTFCSTDSVTLTSNQSGGLLWSNGKTTQSIVVKSSGTYTATITNGFGCSATSTATVVTVNAVPSTPTILFGGSNVFCAGDSSILQSSATSGNQWLLGGVVIPGATGQQFSAKVAGRYSVRVTNASGCSSVSLDTLISVNPAPATPIVTASGATTFCSGDSVVLTSSSATNNLWSTGERTASIVVKNSTAITVTVSNSFGCTSTSAVTNVVSNAKPSVPTISFSKNPVICSNDSVKLTSSSATNNQWLLNGGTIVGGTSQVYRPLTSGRYSVKVTNAAGCSSVSIDSQVTINPVPTTPIIQLSGATTFCAGDSVVLTSPQAFQNSWTTGDTTRRLVVRNSGSYGLSVSNTFGCTASSAPIVVTVNALPAKPIIKRYLTTLVTSGPGPFQWYLNGVAIPGETNYFINIKNNGIYTVAQSNASGCLNFANVEKVYDIILKDDSPKPSDIPVEGTGSSIAELRKAGFADWNFVAYPNPTSSILNLKFTQSVENQKTIVELMDMSGRVLKSEVVYVSNGTIMELDLSSFSSGLYLVRIQSNNSMKSAQITVVR